MLGLSVFLCWTRGGELSGRLLNIHEHEEKLGGDEYEEWILKANKIFVPTL